jgi:type IV pilus assembly protein PilM
MSRLTSLIAAPPPMVGVEISSTHVTAVRFVSGGQPPTVAAAAVEPLPAGAVVPALNESNIRNRAAVVNALRQALDRVGSWRRRAVLAVPDTVAKVSLLKFEKIPTRRADLAELIRWQVRKTVPFRVEDAQLTFVPAGQGPGSEIVVVLARRDLVAEYEGVCQEVGLQVGVVDIATFNVMNAMLTTGTPSGDWLLVNATGDYLALAVLRDSQLLFYRHRGGDGEGSLADVVHQTAMYYEDRLQGSGFSRVVLSSGGEGARAAGQAGDAEEVRRQLEQRLRVRVDPIDPRPGVLLGDRISADAPFLEAIAPAVGLVMRERMA